MIDRRICIISGCDRRATHAPVLLVYPAGFPRHFATPYTIMLHRPCCAEHARLPAATWMNEGVRETARRMWAENYRMDEGWQPDVYDVGLDVVALTEERFVRFEKRMAVSERESSGRLN